MTVATGLLLAAAALGPATLNARPVTDDQIPDPADTLPKTIH